jgi:GNAT superfamily N-acetyltransferase
VPDRLAVVDRLAAHLESWLGTWPPARPVHVIGWPRREEPAWDGRVYPVAGVADGAGLVLSVPPRYAGSVAVLGDDLAEVGAQLPGLVGHPDRPFGRGAFRWSVAPPPLPDAGEWVPPTDSRLPAWLRPFNGDVLVAWDDAGQYAAGVGRKRHDEYAQELAVATEAAHRGRGLARRLVAQATRRVLDEGAVATYLHAFENHASARVAEAAGFPDRGWSVYGLPTAS